MPKPSRTRGRGDSPDFGGAQSLPRAGPPPARRAGKALSEVEHALRERIKELECMYAISTLRELHPHSPERFLQGVVDCLPRSWHFPEYAEARIVYGERRYLSAGFREGPWRMAAEVVEDARALGRVEVFYPKQTPAGPRSPFLPEEQALIRAVAERVGATMTQLRLEDELREAHGVLSSQHEALRESNSGLRAVLSRLEDDKREIRASILSNIQKIIMPIVFELELSVGGRERAQVTLLRQSLQEIASPFLTQLARRFISLTPVEISLCAMLRNGLSSKEIARLRCISTATVRRHRENIRRKLGLANRKVNLVAFLQAGIDD